MAQIKKIYSQEILDSRGNPTLETTILLSDGIEVSSAVPSGASTGKFEACELRDGDLKRFNGKGVLKAVENVNSVIAPKLLGMDASKQEEIDKTMIDLDGTENKSKLGANAILSVSQAVSKGAAKSSSLPLFKYIGSLLKSKNDKYNIPTSLFNLIGGGKHASNNLSFQEFIVVPASSKSYSEGLEIGVAVYQTLKNILHEKGFSTLTSDEGGFGPSLTSDTEVLLLLKEAIEKSSYNFAFDAFLGLDVASTSFKDKNGYNLIDKPNPLSSKELIEFYKNLFTQFSLIYIEDPIEEDDIDGWKQIYTALSSNTLVVGDDLTVTNPKRLEMAIDEKLMNGMIVKPNQIGTVTETIQVCEMAESHGIKIAVAHRSGETMDNFIADFAVGVNADFTKFGAPARERIAKYNRLLEIEKEIKEG